MKVFITGAAGFIGSNLVNYHLSLNDEVYGLDNFVTGMRENITHALKNKSFHFTETDLINYSFTDIPSVDIVYHLASPASPIQYKKHPIQTLRVNSEGTYRTLEFVKKSGSKTFVLASTSEVYGDPEIHPQPETYWGNVNTVGPRACYDEGKRYAEALCYSYIRKYDLDVRIARIFNTYGPNMEQNDGRVISNFIMQSLTGKPLTVYGTGKQTRSFCFISDMVSGLHKLATTPYLKSEIINIGNPDERTIINLATYIQQKTKTTSIIKSCAIDGDDPKQRQPDISKAKKMLGWQPTVPLNKGLDKTITYFKTRYL